MSVQKRIALRHLRVTTSADVNAKPSAIAGASMCDVVVLECGIWINGKGCVGRTPLLGSIVPPLLRAGTWCYLPEQGNMLAFSFDVITRLCRQLQSVTLTPLHDLFPTCLTIALPIQCLYPDTIQIHR